VTGTPSPPCFFEGDDHKREPGGPALRVADCKPGGDDASPHPARLAHLGQHGRELVLSVQRVVPAQEPDAGTGKDFYQRFKHLPPILMRCACPPFG